MRFRLAGRRFTLAQALVITAASAVLPGTAHLCAGYRRAGVTLMSTYLAVLAFCAAIAATNWQGVVELSTRPRMPILLLIVAAAWVTLLIRSYLLLRPPGMPVRTAAGGGAAVAALCLLVVAPALTAAEYGPRHAPVSTMLAGSTPEPAPVLTTPAAPAPPSPLPSKTAAPHAKHRTHARNVTRHSPRNTRIAVRRHLLRHHPPKPHSHPKKHKQKPKAL